MLDEYTARNTDALQSLIENHGVQMKRLPDDVLLSLRETSDQVVREMVAGDELAERIYHSWRDYRDKAVVYQRIAEQAFVVARDLPEKDD
jgi:TRAP-type mannitol/chloroaromatic compound transport system substrate-binding protein